MANITKINSAVKLVDQSGNIYYLWNEGYLYLIGSRIVIKNAALPETTYLYEDILERYNTETPEDYCDYLINNNFFFTPPPDVVDVAITSDNSDYFDELSRGRISGKSTYTKFGYNFNAQTGGEEDLWSFGGAYIFATTPETLLIESDSVNDTGFIIFDILGEDYNSISISPVALQGTTPVPIDVQFFRINRMAAIGTIGWTNDTNEGNIRLYGATTGNTYAYIPAENSITQQLIFTVPADNNATVLSGFIFSSKVGGSSPIVKLQGRFRQPNQPWIVYFNPIIDTSASCFIDIRFPTSRILSPGTDVHLLVNTNTNNTEISGSIYFVLEDINA